MLQRGWQIVVYEKRADATEWPELGQQFTRQHAEEAMLIAALRPRHNEQGTRKSLRCRHC